jgi:hypothetical protein
MAGEKHSTEGSLDSLVRAPPALYRAVQQEATGDGARVGWWIRVLGMAGAGMFMAPDVGAGPFASVVHLVVIEGGAPVEAGPAAEL